MSFANLKSRMKKIRQQMKENEGVGLRLLLPGGMIVIGGTEGKSRKVVDWDGNLLSNNESLNQYGKYSKEEVEAKIEEMRLKKDPNEVWIIDDIEV